MIAVLIVAIVLVLALGAYAGVLRSKLGAALKATARQAHLTGGPTGSGSIEPSTPAGSTPVAFDEPDISSGEEPPATASPREPGVSDEAIFSNYSDLVGDSDTALESEEPLAERVDQPLEEQVERDEALEEHGEPLEEDGRALDGVEESCQEQTDVPLDDDQERVDQPVDSPGGQLDLPSDGPLDGPVGSSGVLADEQGDDRGGAGLNQASPDSPAVDDVQAVAWWQAAVALDSLRRARQEALLSGSQFSPLDASSVGPDPGELYGSIQCELDMIKEEVGTVGVVREAGSTGALPSSLVLLATLACTELLRLLAPWSEELSVSIVRGQYELSISIEARGMEPVARPEHLILAVSSRLEGTGCTCLLEGGNGDSASWKTTLIFPLPAISEGSLDEKDHELSPDPSE